MIITLRRFFGSTYILYLLISIGNASFAQVRCATVEHTISLYKKFNKVQQPEVFERWLQQRKQLRLQPNGQQRTNAAPYRIPVVVHIIHNGEPIGVGRNISDEQIISQLKVLNNDFKRLNADANQTPAEFLSVAGSLDVQFILARQDPDGNATTGIVRMAGRSLGYDPESTADEQALKSLSYWPSEDYLNIWVCFLQKDYLGYAQFPISSLEGLEEYQNEIAATDGVVITYDAFGSDEDGDFTLATGFNKGRTLTHEVGHFLGLRHIWGDVSSCLSTTDYVDDTPKQNDDTRGCPSHPQTSCSNTKMFQNFMDYTNDPCMNLFTQGQMDRMQVVLENSVRRVSLLSSIGLVSPPGGLQNVALRSILSPEPVSCPTNNMLKIRFQNLGDDPLTYLKLTYQIDTNTPIVSEHLLPAIEYGEYGTLSIPIAVNNGLHELTVTIYDPNGVEDASPNDNLLVKKIEINAPEEYLPTRERFEKTFDNRWTIINPFTDSQWQETSTFYNQSLRFETTNSLQAETSWLVSPLLDFSSLSTSNLRFDWSYEHNSTYPSTLEVKYTLDCGLTYLDLPGFSLSQTTEDATPENEDDWDTRVLSLQPLVGFDNVRLAFIASSFLGNPIFIDNLELYAGNASIKIPIEEVVAIYPTASGDLNITFNVEEKQAVAVSVFDMMGRTIVKGVEPQALNQTKSVDLQGFQTGVYIVHINVGNQFYSQKVFIQAP